MMDRRAFLGLTASAAVGSQILPAAIVEPEVAAPGEILYPVGTRISFTIAGCDLEDIAILQASKEPGTFLFRVSENGFLETIRFKGCKRFPIQLQREPSASPARSTIQPQKG